VLLVLTLAVTIAVNMALAGRFYGKGLARAR
jgi:hypothetical protein